MKIRCILLIVVVWTLGYGQVIVSTGGDSDVLSGKHGFKPMFSPTSLKLLQEQAAEVEDCFKLDPPNSSSVFLLSTLLERVHVDESQTRGEAVKVLLGTEVFQSLELHATAAFRNSTNEEVRLSTMRLIKCGLGSSAIDEDLRQIVSRGLICMQNKSPLPSSFTFLFSAAETLALSGDDCGFPILSFSLRSNRLSDALKQRALKVYFQTRNLPDDNVIRTLLMSENVETAFYSSKLLERMSREKAYMYLDDVVSKFNSFFPESGPQSGNSLPRNALLSELTTFLCDACRHNALSESAENGLKKAVLRGLMTDDEATQEILMSLFALIAGDDTVEISRKMLESGNSMIRARAALALSNCSPKVISSFSDRLIAMLSAEQSSEALSFEQMFSLYTLRRGLGETRIRPIVSIDEFSALKEHITRQYIEK